MKDEPARPAARADDDYQPSWERSLESEGRTSVQRTSSSASPWTIAAVITSSIAIMLWLGTMGMNLSRQAKTVAPAEYAAWAKSISRSSFSSVMFPAVKQLDKCVQQKNNSCACAVTLRSMSSVQAEEESVWSQSSGDNAALHAALKSALVSYEDLRRAHTESCASGGNTARLVSPVDQYISDHNSFVDALEAVKQ